MKDSDIRSLYATKKQRASDRNHVHTLVEKIQPVAKKRKMLSSKIVSKKIATIRFWVLYDNHPSHIKWSYSDHPERGGKMTTAASGSSFVSVPG